MDIEASSDAARLSVSNRLEQACADGVQIECDLDRDEISVFVPNRRVRDSFDPAIVSTLDEWLERVETADRRRLRAELHSLWASSVRGFETRFRVLTRDDCAQWVDLRGIVVRDECGSVLRIVAHQRAPSGIEESKASLLPSPYHDPLTGLPNRRLFERRLSDAVDWAQRESGHRFAVFFVDLDRFKAVNDRHGHLVGDRTLLAVAQRLSHCVRPDDVLARRDGDEFTILVTDMRYQSDAAAVAERILLQLQSPLSVNDAELTVSASIGIALSGTERHGPDDLLRSADEAMYQAKARGGGCYVIAGRERQNQRFARSILSRVGS